MPVEDKFIPFKLFLTFGILFPSFRLENLTMTFFDPLLCNQWQSSILEESTSTFSFLNNRRAVSVLWTTGELCQFSEQPESCVSFMNNRRAVSVLWTTGELCQFCQQPESCVSFLNKRRAVSVFWTTGDLCQFSEQPEGCVFQFWIFDSLGEAA